MLIALYDVYGDVGESGLKLSAGNITTFFRVTVQRQ
jgi:hypothetical protein